MPATGINPADTRFRKIFMDHSAAMLLINPDDGKIIESNTAAAQFYGYSRDELENMHVHQINIMSADDIRAEMDAAANEKRNHFIFRHRLANGSIRVVEVHSSPAETGESRILFSIIHDITDRIEAEKARREAESRFDLMLDNVPVGITIFDAAGTVTACNSYLELILGASAREIVGTNVPSKIQNPEQKQAIANFLSGKIAIWEGDYTSVLGGKTTAIRSLYLPYVNPDGKCEGGICLTENLEATKNIAAKIEAEREFSRGIIANMQDGFSLIDATGMQTEVNEAFRKMTGFSREELIGHRAPNYPYWPPEELGEIQKAFENTLSGADATFELTFMRKNGERFRALVSPSAIKDHEGNIVSYVASIKDITERKRAEERIHNLAFYDHLTELPNRRLLLEHLKQSQHTHARRNNHGAILFIDVDHFKKVNDTKGHPAGDALLIQIAQRMKDCVHVDDTVARWSGDEFVILLNDLHEEEVQAAVETETFAEKLRLQLAEPYKIEGIAVHTTVSIGICLFGSEEDTVDEILKRADTAMYQAKNLGRNAIHFFDSAMHAVMSARIALETDLRSAIPGGQMQLCYQPQVDGSGKIVGAEALVRWLHPEHGLIQPNRFIALAEESDLIFPLGLWVLENACMQLKRWQAHELTRDLIVSVNVSTREFRQPDFAERILRVVEEQGVPGSKLKLELTESVALTELDKTLSKMEKLRAAGLSFAIDDFGTGFSSLTYLSRLPFDQLKIDQSFIRSLKVRVSDALLVQTIIGMANNLGMNAIAEGVETEDQLSFLRQHGCGLYQGFLFSKAVEAEKLESILQNPFLR
jgi:diguanylate cyclase (GGDEF)-like protein/PAS domain S-box-containing protein